jgi:hypothetical protein
MWPIRVARIVPGLLLALFIFIQPSMAWRLPFVPENGLGGIAGKLTGDLQPVGKVSVVLVQQDKIIDKTETDADGFYKFRYVEEGMYDIKATKDGYRTCIVLKIPVIPDHVTKLDFYLPRFNNDHMPDDPIVETYDHYYKYMDHPTVSYPR